MSFASDATLTRFWRAGSLPRRRAKVMRARGLAITWNLALSLGLGLGAMACGRENSTPPPQAKAPTTRRPPAQPTIPFVERWQQSPEQERGLLLLQQLRVAEDFSPGSTASARPLSSHYRLELEVDSPPERRRPSRSEKRPGLAYAAPISTITESSLLFDPKAKEPHFQLVQSLQGDQSSHRVERYLAQNGHLWTQINEYPWLQGPLDDDFFELWMLEHRKCIADFLELAQNRLRAQGPTGPLQGPGPASTSGSTLRIELALDPEAEPSKPSQAAPQSSASMAQRRAWRSSARVLQLSGWVELEAERGTWRAADLRLDYEIQRPGITPFRAQARLVARSQAKIDASQWLAPDVQRPLPLPPRYRQESRELLRGLAPL